MLEDHSHHHWIFYVGVLLDGESGQIDNAYDPHLRCISCLGNCSRNVLSCYVILKKVCTRLYASNMYFLTRLNISKHHFCDLQPNNSRKSSCQCDEFIQSPYECDNLHSTFRLELGDVCSRQAFDVSILLGIVNDWLSSFQCFHQGYVQDYSRCGLGQ